MISFFLNNNSTILGATPEMLKYDQDRYSSFSCKLTIHKMTKGRLQYGDTVSLGNRCFKVGSEQFSSFTRASVPFIYAACLLLDNIPILGRLFQLFREKVLGVVLTLPEIEVEVKVSQPNGDDFSVKVSGKVSHLKQAIAKRDCISEYQIALYIVGQEDELYHNLSVAECTNVFMLIKTMDQARAESRTARFMAEQEHQHFSFENIDGI